MSLVPFVSSLRVQGEALILGSAGGDTLNLRAQVLEAWDAIRIDADPLASVRSLKELALKELYPGARAVVVLPYAGRARGVVTAVVGIRLGARVPPVERRYRLLL